MGNLSIHRLATAEDIRRSGGSLEFVYGYTTHQAELYISGDYAYTTSGNQAKYWINGDFWHPVGNLGRPSLWRNGRYIYSYPAGSTPKYYTV